MCKNVKNDKRRCGPNAVNDPTKSPRAPLIYVKSGHSLQILTIDIVGPTLRPNTGHEWLKVVSDQFSKFAQAFPAMNTSEGTLQRR